MLKIIKGVLFTALVVCAIALQGCGEKARRLEYKYKAGDVLKYKFTMETQGQLQIDKVSRAVSSQSEAEVIQNIVDVDKNVISMNETVKPLVMESSGKALPLPHFKVTPVKMDNLGRIIGGEGTENMPGTFLPAVEVKHGDKWSGEGTVRCAGGRLLKLKTAYIFTGYEKVKGYDCAKIQLEIEPAEIPLAEGRGIREGLISVKGGSGEISFAYENGMLVSSSTTLRLGIKFKMADSANKYKDVEIINFMMINFELI